MVILGEPHMNYQEFVNYKVNHVLIFNYFLK